MAVPIATMCVDCKEKDKMGLAVIVLTISLIIVIIDQISKYLIRSTMELHETIPVIKNFFHLTYVSNDGMAFGINFPGGIYLFTIASFILTVFLIGYLWYERKSNIILEFLWPLSSLERLVILLTVLCLKKL